MLLRFIRNILVMAALAIGAAVSPAFADQPATYTARFSNVAVGGYDVVSYFTENRPVRGTEQFKIIHRGAEYRFASAEHLATFRANPDRYAPIHLLAWPRH